MLLVMLLLLLLLGSTCAAVVVDVPTGATATASFLCKFVLKLQTYGPHARWSLVVLDIARLMVVLRGLTGRFNPRYDISIMAICRVP